MTGARGVTAIHRTADDTTAGGAPRATIRRRLRGARHPADWRGNSWRSARSASKAACRAFTADCASMIAVCCWLRGLWAVYDVLRGIFGHLASFAILQALRNLGCRYARLGKRSDQAQPGHICGGE